MSDNLIVLFKYSTFEFAILSNLPGATTIKFDEIILCCMILGLVFFLLLYNSVLGKTALHILYSFQDWHEKRHSRAVNDYGNFDGL